MSSLETRSDDGRDVFRVVIIGAGIAGLAMAIGLRSAGHEVVILERLPEFPSASACFHLSPNACRALQGLGLLSTVEKHSVELQDVTLLSYADGKALRSLDLIPDMRIKYGMPYLSTHRATFHKSMEDRARAEGVQLELGCTVTSIDFETPSVTLEDGRVFSSDLVLGADGALSQCRSLLLGRPDPPHNFGHSMFSCEISQDVLRGDEYLKDLVDIPTTPYWLGPGTLCLGNVVRENGSFNLLGGIAESVESEVRTHPRLSDMVKVKEHFKDWDPKLRRLLDVMPFCMTWTLTAISELNEWSHPNGKFALLGDAAHAMTPYLAQGASQSLEDATFLSQLLRHATLREQIPEIISIYEKTRKPRVHQLKRQSEAMRDVYCLPDGPMQQERDRQLRDTTQSYSGSIPWMDPKWQSWLYSYDAIEEADTAWKRYQESK